MKYVLLGLHDKFFVSSTKRMLEVLDNRVDLVTTVDDLFLLKDQENEGFPFDICIMDTNLGSYGADSYESTQRVYEHFKRRIDAGQITFMTITGNDNLVVSAKEAGFLVMVKDSAFNEYLMNL